MAPDTAPLQLQHVLRLIHCLQKERGASSGLSGFRGVADADADANNSLRTHTLRVASCRCVTNSAIASFYASGSWYNHCMEAEDKIEVAKQLYDVRQLVDGVGEANGEGLAHYHLILTEFNSFVASVIQAFVVQTITKRKKIVKQALKTLNKSPEEAQLRKNYEIALSLMSLILSFVNLKESLGMERATLTGLMAFGANVVTNDRLPVIVNDLVMVVENHHRIMRELEKESGIKMESWSESYTITTSELAYDENYCSLLNLIAESIKPSDSMRTLQDHIRKDFDVNAFQQEMSMEAFWSGITLYMDKLHSTELILLEELATDDIYGKKSYQDLDLLSLGTSTNQGLDSTLHAALKRVALENNNLSKRGATEVVNKLSSEELTKSMIAFLTQDFTLSSKEKSQVTTKDNGANNSSPSRVGMKAKASLEDWEISLYDVEFQKRIGRGAAGTTYLGKWCGQQVAIKVAAINDIGLDGWSNELKSLTKLHHCNIIHFLGAIYNPSPLTYCLVLEYCNGGDLDLYLHGNGGSSTPPNFFETVSKGVASGLLYLHKKNIMHRDIKPGNVLLSGDLKGNFTAKLTDFGLSAMLQNTSANNGGDLTAETGTYRYMAPEVIKHQKYQYPADIYSLSVLMWEILTREVPFKNMSQIEAAGSVAVEGKRPPFPEGIPPYVRFMIEKCWSASPEDRMSTEDVIKTLEELENHLSEESKSWLNAPSGHPVYDCEEKGKTNAHHSQAIGLKKKSKKSLFRGFKKP